MPYRERLLKTASDNPKELHNIWRQERSTRIGKWLCLSGLVLSLIATVADFFYSAPSVILTDLILVFGCGLSWYWIRAKTRPVYYWWPMYGGFWISLLPSFWTTGGLSSPYFAINLATLYILGAVMEARHKSYAYMAFALVHIPVFLFLEDRYKLSSVAVPPIALTVIMAVVMMVAIFICVQSLLRTEGELSLEFAEHYRNLAKTEAELKKRQYQLNEAQSIARIGSWEWDIKADHITWSDELFKIFSVSKENFDPSFAAYLERLNPEIRNKMNALIQRSLKSGEDFVFESKNQVSGGAKYILSQGRVVKDASGIHTKMVGTSQDITERKLIEDQLVDVRNELERRVEKRTRQLAESLERERAAKIVAENASQAKMQFLANMSHEIRTPMNSILGFSDLLGAEAVSSADAQEYLNRIRSNGAQLMHLIDDILDLSKFEAGKMSVYKNPFYLKPVVDEVLRSFEPSLRAKGLGLEVRYQGLCDKAILSDRHRLSQVVINLVGNSIKFSESGKISIDVNCILKSKNEAHVTFDIEDQGIGITAENQKNLFVPFSQGDGSIARKFGGSGLGLALSLRITEALGGKLELVKSTAAVGTHFRFDFPVEVAAENALAKKASENLKTGGNENKIFQGKNILIVDDSEDNAILLRYYVESLGAKIEVASDGIQAVEMASERNYDCILMDVQMPAMDGLEATRRIRAQGFTQPIIALTAHALPEEAEKSRKAGCNLHLTKPINRAELIGNLVEQLKLFDV